MTDLLIWTALFLWKNACDGSQANQALVKGKLTSADALVMITIVDAFADALDYIAVTASTGYN